MILQGKNSFQYWSDLETNQKVNNIYSWKNVFGTNPLAVVLPFEHKDKSSKSFKKLFSTTSL